jgi:hypothetical protein
MHGVSIETCPGNFVLDRARLFFGPRARNFAEGACPPKHLERHIDPDLSLIGSKTWADWPTFSKTDPAQSAALKRSGGALSCFLNFLIFSCFC